MSQQPPATPNPYNEPPPKEPTQDPSGTTIVSPLSSGHRQPLTSDNRESRGTEATQEEYAPVGFRIEGELVFAKNGRLLTSPAEISTMTAARHIDFDGNKRRMPVAQDLSGNTQFRYYNTYPFVAKRFCQTQRVLLATRSLARTPGPKMLEVPTLPIEIDGTRYAITRTFFVGRARVGFVTITPLKLVN